MLGIKYSRRETTSGPLARGHVFVLLFRVAIAMTLRNIMLSNSQRKYPKVIVGLSLLLTGLCLSAMAHADTLEAWRESTIRTRILAENDVPGALQEAQRLQANIPPDATPVDKARVLNLLSRIESYAALTEQ